MSVFDEKM